MFSLKCPCCGSEVVPGENIPVGMKNMPKFIIFPNCKNELMLDKKLNFQRNIIGIMGLIGIPLIGHYIGVSTVAAYFGMGLILMLAILLVVFHKRLKLVPLKRCNNEG